MTAKATPKARKAKAVENETQKCNFCVRDDRMSLVRLLVGEESRLIWVCPDHRG